jgi:mercuric reductase
MSKDAWDLVVIGTGGAAMAAGSGARSRDKQVLLVEHGPLGGTCLNIGCVPSKHLLAAAGQRHRALSNRAFPMVTTGADGVDLPALMAQKQGLIDGLRQHDGERVVGRAYLIATGAAPHVPDLPGSPRCSG